MRTAITIAIMGLLTLALSSFVAAAEPASAPRPHIVVIVADDLGWHDVGFHGSEIRTAHLDRLAAAGTQLGQFYVQPVCSPTRASLMTGRYPIRYGLQVMVVRPWADYGLPLEERTLAQALKEVGYRTAITGKWHLGHCDRSYLPMKRGFDHQYGCYNGAIDYFTHIRDGGLDWHRDDRGLEEEGYSTNLIAAEAARIVESHDPARPLFLYVPFNAPHGPLQAPQEYIDKYRQIEGRHRRLFAAMVHCMDDGIGRILDALDKRGMRDNTLIFFSSDNGGPTGNGGADNTPLRAGKATLYEGGVRVPALMVWPGRVKAGAVVNEPLHMVDLYPTLLKLAGASLKQPLPLDGRDLWPTIAEGKASPHEEILHNSEPGRAAIRRGDWKLLRYDGEAGQPPTLELYNIARDETEKANLAPEQPDVVKELSARLDLYARQAVPPKYKDKKPPGFESPKVWGEPD